MSSEAQRGFDARVARIEGLVAQIEGAPDEDVKEASRELTATLLELHRVGLARVIALIEGAGDAGRSVMEACARDDLVASLFALHELEAAKATPPKRAPLTSIPGRETALVPLRRSRDATEPLALASAAPPVERCDLCKAPVPSPHAHLVHVGDRAPEASAEPAASKLLCACPACAVLFEDGAGGRPYRRVPRDVVVLPGFEITEAEWSALGVPVQLAFFFESSRTGELRARYPSAVGATESVLARELWNDLAARSAPLRAMRADVEALLVNRVGGARDYVLAPIDRCYELTGVLRARHGAIARAGRGEDDDVRRFFTRLRGEAVARG